MFTRPSQQLAGRIESLQKHLANENPLLVEVVKSFQRLDKVAYRMGLMRSDESFATRISWWPLISVLGTFSAGKSSFINQYLAQPLQLTGNQAVDDRFTVICYSRDNEVRVLPGLALDADPRFPFYQISEEIEKVAAGEGARIDTYLQLKTCRADTLRGRILIDSPGFDADEQRNSTLRITDHIIDLSDLVLVFFDARHPEPGSMQDTLEHLVAGTIQRNDSSKVLFILNQTDTAASEDNIEDVVAAWQRAIAQGGVASGRFYCIYNEELAMPIDDPHLRSRYQSKRDVDLHDIYARMEKVSVERVYRIIGSLENSANLVERTIVPALKDGLMQWRKGVLRWDLVAFGFGGALLLAATIFAGYWQGLSFRPPWWEAVSASPVLLSVIVVLLLILAAGVHFAIRGSVAGSITRRLQKSGAGNHVLRAFKRNTRAWRSIAWPKMVGWDVFSRKRLRKTREEADRYVQKFNDEFTNPSGGAMREDERAPEAEPRAPTALEA
ncbi:MAG: dynamin family protein [Gammaproteobacteria bacterium]